MLGMDSIEFIFHVYEGICHYTFWFKLLIPLWILKGNKPLLQGWNRYQAEIDE